MTETDRKFPDERFKNRNYKIGLRPDLIKDCRYVCCRPRDVAYSFGA